MSLIKSTPYLALHSTINISLQQPDSHLFKEKLDEKYLIVVPNYLNLMI